MKNKSVLVWCGYSALIVLLLTLSFIAGQALALPRNARAQEGVDAEVPNLPNAPNASFYCDVNNVASFDNRIHIRCNNSNNGIYYYAYPTDPSNVATANQFLAIGNTAYALGHHVWVYYNSSSSLNPTGCNTGDCRGLWGISMVP